MRNACTVEGVQEMFERLHPHNLSVATPTSHATATTTAQTTTPTQRQVGAQKVVYAADKAAPAAVLKGAGCFVSGLFSWSGNARARETLHSSGSVQSIQKETRIKEEPRVVEKDVE